MFPGQGRSQKGPGESRGPGGGQPTPKTPPNPWKPMKILLRPPPKAIPEGRKGTKKEGREDKLEKTKRRVRNVRAKKQRSNRRKLKRKEKQKFKTKT